MPGVWTHGVWTVQPGREEEFVAAWTEMASQGMSTLAPVEPPVLLRDREQPNVFISFGPWESIERVADFRSSEAFRFGQERMREVLQSFEPRTLDEVTRGG
jgi:heme-degrading monooxygenase HmoA